MIRRGTPTDWDWIARVAAEVYGDLGDYGSIIPSWLQHPGVLTYIDEPAADSPVLRGFILLGFYQPEECDETTYVADLLAIAVAPAHQRQGVGRGLLAYAIEVSTLASRANVVPEIRLTVAHTNGVGQRLFTNSGFTVMDDDHGSYDGGQRAIRMSRPLP